MEPRTRGILEGVACRHAVLIAETKNIKLGTGTSNLSHMHPVLIASHAAMLDHLSKGRFIFGISPGALRCDAEVLGIINEDRGQIFAESIDVILEIWRSDPPYNIDLPNNRFKVSSLESTFLEVKLFTRWHISNLVRYSMYRA